MDNYLIHYRTPGSKNGIRKYQNPDGTYTALGKIHYGIIGKNNRPYYDPKYEPKFYDEYGKEKQKELNSYKEQISNKTYKGYERAEMHDQPQLKNDWNTKKTAKKIEENYRIYKEHEEKWNASHPTNSDQVIQASYESPIKDITTEENIKKSADFLKDMSDFLQSPIEFLIKKWR